MSHFVSIHTSIRNSVIATCLLMFLIASAAIIATIELEREHWKKQQIEDYKNLAVTLIKTEFYSLKEFSNTLAHDPEIYQAVNLGTTELIYSIVNPRTVKYYGADIFIVQGIDGKISYSASSVEERFLNDLRKLHEPFVQKSFSLFPGIGINFIEGRIFMFSSSLVAENTGTKPAGMLTLLKEIDNPMLEKISKQLGKEFNFHYTSAGMRLTQINYNQDYTIELYETIEKQDGFEAVYQMTMADGRLQPANFIIKFNAFEYTKGGNPYYIIGLVCVFIALVSLLVWLMFLSRVLAPVSKLTQLIGDETVFAKGSNSDIEEDDFPLELKQIYSRFNHVYSKMSQQNQFSQVLVGAIGDIIITVNPAGRICYANPAARQWFGVCETLLIGQPLELFTSNISSETPDVATWLYSSNVGKERVRCSCSLVNIICKEYVYSADVIVQPIDLVKDEHDSSSSVIVIRIKEKIAVEDFFA